MLLINFLWIQNEKWGVNFVDTKRICGYKKCNCGYKTEGAHFVDAKVFLASNLWIQNAFVDTKVFILWIQNAFVDTKNARKWAKMAVFRYFCSEFRIL